MCRLHGDRGDVGTKLRRGRLGHGAQHERGRGFLLGEGFMRGVSLHGNNDDSSDLRPRDKSVLRMVGDLTTVAVLGSVSSVSYSSNLFNRLHQSFCIFECTNNSENEFGMNPNFRAIPR